MTNTRIRSEISALTVLLCMLVIFIHVSSSPVTTLEKDTWQYAVVLIPWRLSAFVVQGFVFLSGVKLFLNNKSGFSYKKFYLSRITMIIVPYIIWNIIYYLYFINNGYYEYSFGALAVYILNGSLVSPFYFIVIIVQFYALMPIWRLMVKRINPVILLALCSVITIIFGQFFGDIINVINPDWDFNYTDRVFITYLLYWVAGCYAGENYEKFLDIIKKYRYFIIISFLVIMVIEAPMSYLSFSGIIHISSLEYVHYLYCIIAVLFFFSLFAFFYENRTMENKVIKAINESSYEIYLIHCLFIYIINNIMIHWGMSGIAETYLIRIIFVYVSSIIVSILLRKTKRKLFKL